MSRKLKRKSLDKLTSILLSDLQYPSTMLHCVTAQKIILRYPSIFTTRGDVLVKKAHAYVQDAIYYIQWLFVCKILPFSGKRAAFYADGKKGKM